MKRNGLRALALASCVVALFSILTVAVDVQNILYNELIEEINLAAGLALVDQYIADYTVEELEELVTYGRTPGERLAADRALFEINGGLIPLIGEDADALLALAEAGDQDAADAWVFLNRSSYSSDTAAEEAIMAGDLAATIEYAVGYNLGGFYGPGSPRGEKTVDELIVLAKNSEYYGIRVAAAVALSTNWIIDQPLDIAQTQAAILGVTLVYPELALAYQIYLTYLFGL
jgi:hypothetical protein